MRMIWKWAAGALVGVVAFVMAWRSSNVAVALDAVARLRLVWPDITILSEPDRALVSQLAVHCDLPAKASTPEAAIACLRESAVHPRFALPAGIHDAAAELELMLARRPGDSHHVTGEALP